MSNAISAFGGGAGRAEFQGLGLIEALGLFGAFALDDNLLFLDRGPSPSMTSASALALTSEFFAVLRDNFLGSSFSGVSRRLAGIGACARHIWRSWHDPFAGQRQTTTTLAQRV